MNLNKKDNNTKIIYFLLTHSGSLLGEMIKKFTKVPYSHVSIGFHPELSSVYSFGRKYVSNPLIGTFVKEELDGKFFKKFPNTKYSLYAMEISNLEFEKLKISLKWFEGNRKNFRYNFLGLFTAFLGTEWERRDKYFCSQFVATLLELAEIGAFDKHPSVVKPHDFTELDGTEFISAGKIKYFDKNKVTKKIMDIFCNDKIKKEKEQVEIL